MVPQFFLPEFSLCDVQHRYSLTINFENFFEILKIFSRILGHETPTFKNVRKFVNKIDIKRGR